MARLLSRLIVVSVTGTWLLWLLTDLSAIAQMRDAPFSVESTSSTGQDVRKDSGNDSEARNSSSARKPPRKPGSNSPGEDVFANFNTIGRVRVHNWIYEVEFWLGVVLVLSGPLFLGSAVLMFKGKRKWAKVFFVAGVFLSTTGFCSRETILQLDAFNWYYDWRQELSN